MLDPALNFPHAEYENHGISMRNQLIYRLEQCRLEPGWSTFKRFRYNMFLHKTFLTKLVCHKTFNTQNVSFVICFLSQNVSYHKIWTTQHVSTNYISDCFLSLILSSPCFGHFFRDLSFTDYVQPNFLILKYFEIVNFFLIFLSLLIL